MTALPAIVDAARSSTRARYVALVRLLVRHGRGDLVSGAGLDQYRSADELPTGIGTAARTRHTDSNADPTDTGDPAKAAAFAADLEEMGATYVKLGQLLSTRSDLLPAAYIEALARLRASQRDGSR